MEKKFLTYSKRTIRPNGGVDPTMFVYILAEGVT